MWKEKSKTDDQVKMVWMKDKSNTDYQVKTVWMKDKRKIAPERTNKTKEEST
jgi:hypothetical protein